MKKMIGLGCAIAFVLGSASSAFADWDDDRIWCKGKVSYDGKVYELSQTDDSEFKAQRELIEEACEQACYREMFEDACEFKCEQTATLSDVQCGVRPYPQQMYPQQAQMPPQGQPMPANRVP